jgi:subtilisin family serine protease
MHTRRLILILSCLLITAMPAGTLQPLARSGPAQDQRPALQPPFPVQTVDIIQIDKKNHGTPRLDGTLDRLVEAYTRTGQVGLDQAARQHHIMLQDDKVLVVVEGDVSRLPATLTRLGGEINSVASDRLSLLAPVSSLRAMAASPGVLYVRPPLPAFALEMLQGDGIVSEGVSVLGAKEWHAAGFNGRGVRAAVIDFGFYDWTGLRDNGELPENTVCVNHTTSFNCGNANPEQRHGSACAEILHDVAPGIDALYLYAFDDEVDLEHIVQEMIDADVDVVSLSVGWVNGEPYDGSGFVSSLTNRAKEVGDVFWVAAAGNHRLRHWEGRFVDANDDKQHEFDAAGNALNILAYEGGYHQISGRFVAALTWNDWPYTNQDYDLHLLRWDGTQWQAHLSSDHAQDGDDPPAELLGGDLVPGIYALLVEAAQQTGDPEYLELFTFYADLDARYRVEGSSILEPATADGTVAVAAFPLTTPATLEAFSSMGPRNPSGGGPYDPNACGGERDPACKPDFAGPDGVSTASYSPSLLRGTSAAAPHIAGAAALVQSAHPSWTSDELYDFLKSRAPASAAPMAEEDFSSLGTSQDLGWGWGRVHLGDPPQTSLVELARLQAIPQGSIIRVEWETSTEINNLGFNVYRRALPDGQVLQLNEALIPTRSLSPPEGAAYTLPDAGVEPGSPYEYKLEAVGVHGQTTSYDPVQVVAATGTLHRLALPLVLSPRVIEPRAGVGSSPYPQVGGSIRRLTDADLHFAPTILTSTRSTGLVHP